MVTKTKKRTDVSGARAGLQFDILDDPIERVVELFVRNTTPEERALLLAFREIGPSNNSLSDRIADEIAKSLIEATANETEGSKAITYISGLLAGLAIGRSQ